MTFVSYAQNFEDVLLWRVFRTTTAGFYIDVGASHPDTDSVTRSFYDRGWSGINVEPVPEYYERLRAARPRDINLRLAAGRRSMDGKVYVVAGTGLSTTDEALAEQHRANSFDVRPQDVLVRTLADICRDHAPEVIHFLKIDVEGGEQDALAGADFAAYRPWIILVESTAPGTTIQTHQEWEPDLLAAGYRFLYFDGLNRFYAAIERYDQVAPHFVVPVCVFDDFLRAADSEWTRRISHAEMQAADLLERSMSAEASIDTAEARARDAERRAHDAELRAHDAETRVNHTELRMQAVEHRARSAEAQTLAAEARNTTMLVALRSAQEDAASLRASTSWKLTAPVRRASSLARLAAHSGRRVARTLTNRLSQPGDLTPAAPQESDPGTPLLQKPMATRLALRRAVHQFHAGSAYGDAITNAMLMIRTRLRALGYRSEIYVVHRDPALVDELFLLSEMPRHDEYVLLLHHSMGFDAFDEVMAFPAPKVLIYHNITPPEHFAGLPDVQRYCGIGREQLGEMRNRVVAALADSEYNAIELRRLGFGEARACTLLFDLDVMRRQFGGSRRQDEGGAFTIIFVGRVVSSKGQLDLVRAFASFQKLSSKPGRLVLIGRQDGAGQDYARTVRMEIHALGLDAHVTMTGLISDEELRAHYARADLYVSLSRHEGFGVPLIEAAMAGVPVLAWPAGAVAFTMGDPSGVLHSRDPNEVGARMAELARDPNARANMARAQQDAVSRFALDRQIPTLVHALARAGAAAPPDEAAERLLAQNMHFTIVGHVNSFYSLAAINRTLARILDTARPGAVRLLPVEEGQPTQKLDDVPAEDLDFVTDLSGRPAHDSGPVVTISQHYPVYVPQDAGDVLLSYLFWEESLLPADTVGVLNRNFQGMLAPSRFVAKALIDSGVSLPVHVVGFAPDLASYATLAGPDREDRHDHVFLHVSSAFPRKGVDVLLAAFVSAFRAADPVRLIIKTFPNPHNDVAARIAALQTNGNDVPRIELIDRDMDPAEMLDLYRGADTMVLPARGEGFNLPAAEAMAAGLPLIVTGYGGHMDFCSAETARLLSYKLAVSGSHVSSSLSLWAEPDVEDLTAALREQVHAPEQAKARARAARFAIAEATSRPRFIAKVERAALGAMMQQTRRSLRVTVVSSWNVRCGIAEYTRFLLEGLRQAEPGLDVLMLSDSRAETVAATIPVRTRQVWGLGSADAPAALQSAVSLEDPDAVLIQHQPGLLPWAILGGTLSALSSPNRPLAVTLHNTAHLLDVDEEDRALALKGLASASRVIVHGVADVERLHGLGLTRNVVLLPHGAQPPLPVNSPRDLIRNDTITIGSYGFLLRDKGVPELIAAAGLLKQRWPHLRLKLLNADYGAESQPVLAACHEAANAAGLSGAVELVTDFLPNEESRARLATCDVIVLPYQQSKESASGALRVALSTGCCVAVTPLSLFADAQDGIYRLPGTDPAAIAEGLHALLEDRDLRLRTRDAARDWLRERDWDRIGARTLGMLRGLLASQPES